MNKAKTFVRRRNLVDFLDVIVNVVIVIMLLITAVAITNVAKEKEFAIIRAELEQKIAVSPYEMRYAFSPGANSSVRPIRSDPFSMARQIAATEGNLLPMPTALDDTYGVISEGRTDSVIQRRTGYATVQDYYESYGIVLGEELYPGWQRCRLPKGWYVEYDDTPSNELEEIIRFFNQSGEETFCVITSKDETDRSARLAYLY